MKTGSEIEQYVYGLINRSEIKSLIKGKVYRYGLRPFNSKNEDCVVSFQTGLNGHFQDGSVNVNIYVPDIPFTDENGRSVLVKDFARCQVIERACQDFINTLTAGEYRFRLASTMQTFPDEETDQHFVNMRLRYERVTF